MNDKDHYDAARESAAHDGDQENRNINTVLQDTFDNDIRWNVELIDML